jgi:hypothetical protein
VRIGGRGGGDVSADGSGEPKRAAERGGNFQAGVAVDGVPGRAVVNEVRRLSDKIARWACWCRWSITTVSLRAAESYRWSCNLRKAGISFIFSALLATAPCPIAELRDWGFGVCKAGRTRGFGDSVSTRGGVAAHGEAESLLFSVRSLSLYLVRLLNYGFRDESPFLLLSSANPEPRIPPYAGRIA